MDEPSSRPGLLRFGAFEVDLKGMKLRRNGVEVRLAGQPFQILLILLERPGEVVTREELRKRLWPADTFVDFDHSLNSAVKKLRQALNDSADSPVYVETMARLGYRFIAPAQTVTFASQPREPSLRPPSPESQTASSKGSRRVLTRRRLALGAGLVAAAVVGMLGFRFLGAVPAPRVTDIVRITESGRAEPWGELFSDGPMVYYLRREGARWDLMQISTKGGPAERVNVSLPNQENVRILDLSPDSSQFLVAGFVERGKKMPIWTVPVQGGPPRRVGDIEARDARWTPSGKEIVYTDGNQLRVVNRNGTGAHLLLTAPGQPRAPVWSRDGRTMFFTVGNELTATSEIWAATRDGKDLHPLLPNWRWHTKMCCGSWTSDGKYFIFAAERQGRSEIWALRAGARWWGRQRSEPVQLTNGPADFLSPAASRNGNQVFAFGVRRDRELLEVNKKSGQLLPARADPRGYQLSYSPDGKWVAYCDGPPMQVWKSRPDGSQAIRLTDPELNGLFPRWSPDGKWIAFTSWPDFGRKAFVVSSNGGAPRQILPNFYLASLPDWSPDGKRLVLEGAETAKDAAEEPIYLYDLPSGKFTKIPGSEGFDDPRWSPSGRFIAARDVSGSRLLLYDMERSRWSELARGTLISAPEWSRDGVFLYYQDLLESNEPVYRIRVKDRAREFVVNFASLLAGTVFRCALVGLTPDGSPIVMASRGYADVYLLDLDLP